MILSLSRVTCILTITIEAFKFVVHDMSIYFSSCAYRMAVQTTSYCEEMYNGYKATLAESVRALVLCWPFILFHSFLLPSQFFGSNQ